MPRLKRGIFIYISQKDIFAVVAIQRLTIEDFIKRSKNQVLLDVRSPAEHGHAHIPCAISLPLFSEEERKIVGTAYKQKGREAAIKIGLDFFAPKMRRVVEEVEAISNSAFGVLDGPDAKTQEAKRDVFVYCWRGGMRSAGVAWLLDLYGFKVCTLAGGYKAFRNYVLQTFDQPFQFKILGGYTGSGKTEILYELEKLGEPVIDLEKIASHKGSAFGSFKMPPQPTQEMFENLLALQLRQINSLSTTHYTSLWLEDESQRIGNLNIPAAIWKNMRRSPVVFLEIPFEERLKHIVEEYGNCAKEKLIEAVERISQRLGGLAAKNAIEYLKRENISEAFGILLKYYDKRYLNGLHNRENLSALLTTLPCETVTPENAWLLTQHQPA